jgi:hypothetical protein
MITLKFKDFMSGKFDDIDAELYVLKNAENILYIGISKRGVWNRWFDNWSSHIGTNYEGKHFGNSPAGREVIENLPASLDWIIELYTLDDCRIILKDEFASMGFCLDRVDIRRCENLMIRKIDPPLNSRS